VRPYHHALESQDWSQAQKIQSFILIQCIIWIWEKTAKLKLREGSNAHTSSNRKENLGYKIMCSNMRRFVWLDFK
jgi:hypothetical protein